MTGDLSLQLELAGRILAAAVLGAALGFERELRGQPAGLRTHVIVSLGAATFTVLSVHGFGGEDGSVDSSRVAAQVVTGIGFLGAGAIFRHGLSVHGLTTAGSLWGAAAIGMAAGVGEYFLAAVATVIVLFVLWPLRFVLRATRLRRGQAVNELRLEFVGLETFGRAIARLAEQEVHVLTATTGELGRGRYEAVLTVRLPRTPAPEEIIAAMTGVEGLEAIEFGGV